MGGNSALHECITWDTKESQLSPPLVKLNFPKKVGQSILRSQYCIDDLDAET